MVGPAAKREGVAHLRARMGLSERRACLIVGADRTTVRYRSCRPADAELRGRLRELANERRRFGYRRLFILLRREGEPSGVNRIHRLYREDGLSVRKRRARRKAVGTRAPILVEARPNARWSTDFVHDQFANGRRLRILNIVDDVTKQCLGAIPDTSISGRRVARELTAIIERHGKPGMIVSDRRGSGNDPVDRFPEEGHGVHLQRHARLDPISQGGLALHRARQADAEWHLRGLQRPHARRDVERDNFLRPRSRPVRDRPMGCQLQPAPSAFGARLPHACGLRRYPHRNRRSAAQPRPAPPIARCSTGAVAPISANDSCVSRMTSRGHSTPSRRTGQPFRTGPLDPWTRSLQL